MNQMPRHGLAVMRANDPTRLAVLASAFWFLIFALPLLMTMEMWWLGFHMDRFRAVVEQNLALRCPELGTIPEDRRVGRATREGTPFAVARSRRTSSRGSSARIGSSRRRSAGTRPRSSRIRKTR